MPTALITGITGQDGSYLAELLLSKGYQVHGVCRRASTRNVERLAHLLDKIHLHDGDVLDQSSLQTLIAQVKPTEVYNLAAQSFVGTSWSQPVLTGEVTGLGVTRLLEGLEAAGFVEKVACETDLRISYAQLTDAGTAKLEQASCGHNRAVLELFEDRFSAEEIEALAEMLARLPGALDESLACPTDV